MQLLKFTRYGDYGDREVAGTSDQQPEKKELATNDAGMKASPSGGGLVGAEWPLFEVFIRSKQGLDHKHVGSLHAADAQMAIENARDVYTRRMEGVSIWVVESKHIHASNPDEAESLYDPASDKVYRHPTFYDLPDELKHM